MATYYERGTRGYDDAPVLRDPGNPVRGTSDCEGRFEPLPAANAPCQVAYIQTLAELVLNEPVDFALYRDECARTAASFGENRLASHSEVVESRRQNGLRACSGIIPGSIPHLANLLPGRFQISCIILDVGPSAVDLTPYVDHYQSTCQDLGIPCHPIASLWRLEKGAQKRLEKARFEVEILRLLQGYSVDCVVLDRAMFLAGLLIDSETSPIWNRVYNSHPGALRGALRNPGATPTIGALELKCQTGVARSAVTFHEVTADVDGGRIISELEFDIEDVYTPEHLRARTYSGIEALCQLRGLGTLTEHPIDWNRPITVPVDRLESIYSRITLPS